ncbi:hypothetical protein Athai_30000 [Actinocatenispora thailandica]|uniref:DUF1453 domain-containing protein n=1 Tax=Actinocatenispora thailandica TaxID=227318 RepID=A0A7R7HWV7_9ACTN|nr:hypothetical protein [Actinocatenispora thailandica]BCJ35497.1 hypothetical protein Athai_30000 [Actinocatenispora thailandica]
MTALSGASTVLVLAIVLVLQFVPRPVRASQLIWVAVLLAAGLAPPGPARPTAAGIGLLVVSLLASAVLAVPRGRSMRVWLDDRGTAWRRGDRRTLGWWLVSIAVRIAFAAGGELLLGEPVLGGSLWLGLAVTLGVQQWALARRVRALGDPASIGTPSTRSPSRSDLVRPDR